MKVKLIAKSFGQHNTHSNFFPITNSPQIIILLTALLLQFQYYTILQVLREFEWTGKDRLYNFKLLKEKIYSPKLLDNQLPAFAGFR